MQIKLNDGTLLDCIVVNGFARQFQGTSRSVLEFHFPQNAASFETLEALFGDKTKTDKIYIMADDGTVQSLQEHYVLRSEMRLIDYVVTPETGTTPGIIEPRYIVTMAQKSYAEIQQDALQDTVDQLVLESLGVM